VSLKKRRVLQYVRFILTFFFQLLTTSTHFTLLLRRNQVAILAETCAPVLLETVPRCCPSLFHLHSFETLVLYQLPQQLIGLCLQDPLIPVLAFLADISKTVAVLGGERHRLLETGCDSSLLLAGLVSTFLHDEPSHFGLEYFFCRSALFHVLEVPVAVEKYISAQICSVFFPAHDVPRLLFHLNLHGCNLLHLTNSSTTCFAIASSSLFNCSIHVCDLHLASFLTLCIFYPSSSST